MIIPLPNVRQLAKLPQRAIVAYALRAARRVMSSCRVQYAQTCDNALHVVNDFVQLPSVPSGTERMAAYAAATVAEAEAMDEVGRNLRVGLAVRAAATCCYYCVTAMSSADADRTCYLEKITKEADRAARQMDETDNELAVADYKMLLSMFGIQKSMVLGESFDPSENGPLGPILRG